MTTFARIAALLAALPIWGVGMNAAPAADTAPRLVEFESPLAGPQALQGYLRLPDGPGPSPAVVLMHGCGGAWRGIDQR
jgi:dienelactone hydrolase